MRHSFIFSFLAFPFLSSAQLTADTFTAEFLPYSIICPFGRRRLGEDSRTSSGLNSFDFGFASELVKSDGGSDLENEGNVVNAVNRTADVGQSSAQDTNTESLDSSGDQLLALLADEDSKETEGIIGSAAIVLCIKKLRGQTTNVAQTLCQCLNLVANPIDQCSVFGFVSKLLTCNGDIQCPFLRPFPFIPPLNAATANLPLMDSLPTPPLISQATIQAEQQTYYLAFKSVALLTSEAALANCSPPPRSPTTINGWKIEINSNMIEAKAAGRGETCPFARLASRPNANNPALTDILISIRGTQTREEWGVDLAYNQILSNVAALSNVGVHRGYMGLANFLMGSFGTFLQGLDNANSLGIITTVGFSLGAGVGSVLSLLLANQFSAVTSSGELRHRLLAFGAPRAGNSAFVQQVAGKVVTRVFAAQLDPVPLLPCDSLPGCPSKFVQVPTAPGLLDRFFFSPLFGRITILQTDLPPLFSTVNGAQAASIYHNCAYDCWTSLAADPTNLSSCLAPPGLPGNPNSACIP